MATTSVSAQNPSRRGSNRGGAAASIGRARGNTGNTLKTTSRGQVTLRKDLLQHMGIQPGDKIAYERMPDGRIQFSAPKQTGRLEDVFGILAGKTKTRLTIEEIKEATERAYAGLL